MKLIASSFAILACLAGPTLCLSAPNFMQQAKGGNLAQMCDNTIQAAPSVVAASPGCSAGVTVASSE